MTTARTDRTTKGAVYVEFLIAFSPMFVFFLSLVQLTFLHTANVVVQHAATKAARAAVVVLDDDPHEYGGEARCSAPKNSRRRTAIEAAAALVLAPLGDSTLELSMNDRYDPTAPVTVKLDYAYRCNVPIGGIVACGLRRTATLHGQATLPNQGATYDY